MKSAHLKGGKGQRPNQSKVDGKKSEGDAYFMYNMAILVGCPCEVTVRDGRKYDGIFAAYAADRRELMIEAAHRIPDEGEDDEAPITEHYDVLVIPTDKMLSTRFKSVDVNYATRDFATDQAISAARNISQRDKELTPWDGADGVSDEDLSLEVGVGVGENGWEAKDMFKKNEEKYGVTSSYKNDLAGYTTQLDKSDVDSFKRHEQQASQVAQEIEKNTISWERGELENGEDEEEAFSAVVRPRNSGHGNINNNNNNNTGSSNAGSDKYIPPSRRQGNVQASAQSMPQNLPMNNNGATQMNNNSGNPRKQMYSQNQNPRGNYGVPPNNIYHDRRNNYDSRRAPPPNQYPNPNSHNEVRRMDDGGRQQRVPNKPAVDRRGGRDDPAKLKEFGNTFRLPTSGEQNQPPRRMPPNQPPHSASNSNANSSTSGSNMSSGLARNPSPPSIPSSKVNKEEVSTPVSTSSQQINADLMDKGSSNAVVTPLTTSGSISASSSSSNIGNVIAPSVNETTPTSGAHTHDNQSPSTGDSKFSDDSKKKFMFNPNAKEFNPSAKSFSSRSPSTPPRPPSTPAAPNTPQMMPAQQIHSFMPIPMPMLYAQPYPQTAALTPSSNSSVSSGGTTPRHGGHRRGGGGMLQPRSEMTPNIQMTAGPPLLAPASLQAAGAPHQYAFVPQGHYSQVMRVGVVPQSVMPVFPTEGGGSTQMHQQVHYIQHNGGAAPNNPGQTPNSTPPNNPNVQTSVVSANGQAYGQQGGHGGPHVGYPFVGLPVMNMGYPHGPPHMITVPYVSHPHQGGTTVIPQSQ